jgi:hypothetical protein
MLSELSKLPKLPTGTCIIYTSYLKGYLLSSDIETQNKNIKKYVSDNNLRILGEYSDCLEVQIALFNRPQLSKMMKYIKSKIVTNCKILINNAFVLSKSVISNLDFIEFLEIRRNNLIMVETKSGGSSAADELSYTFQFGIGQYMYTTSNIFIVFTSNDEIFNYRNTLSNIEELRTLFSTQDCGKDKILQVSYHHKIDKVYTYKCKKGDLCENVEDIIEDISSYFK